MVRRRSVASLILAPTTSELLKIMSWKTIRLELAGTCDFPTGSVSRGYLIRVPLNDNGSIDDLSLAQTPQSATVRRFWSSEPDESGRVTCSNGEWALRCSGKADRFLLGSGSFVVGQEVTVVGPDGVPLPFRVANIRGFG